MKFSKRNIQKHKNFCTPGQVYRKKSAIKKQKDSHTWSSALAVPRLTVLLQGCSTQTFIRLIHPLPLRLSFSSPVHSDLVFTGFITSLATSVFSFELCVNCCCTINCTFCTFLYTVNIHISSHTLYIITIFLLYTAYALLVRCYLHFVALYLWHVQ